MEPALQHAFINQGKVTPSHSFVIKGGEPETLFIGRSIPQYQRGCCYALTDFTTVIGGSFQRSLSGEGS